MNYLLLAADTLLPIGIAFIWLTWRAVTAKDRTDRRFDQ